MACLVPEFFEKTPDEVLDFKIDYINELSGETIDTSVWTIPTGITKLIDVGPGLTYTALIIDAGVIGAEYQLVNHIKQTGGFGGVNLEQERTLNIKIVANKNT